MVRAVAGTVVVPTMTPLLLRIPASTLAVTVDADWTVKVPAQASGPPVAMTAA